MAACLVVEFLPPLYWKRRMLAPSSLASSSMFSNMALSSFDNCGSFLCVPISLIPSNFSHKSVAVVLSSADPRSIVLSTRSSTWGVIASVVRTVLRKRLCQAVTSGRTWCPLWKWSPSKSLGFPDRLPRDGCARGRLEIACCRTLRNSLIPPQPRTIQVAANENTHPKDQISIFCETGLLLLPGYSGAPVRYYVSGSVYIHFSSRTDRMSLSLLTEFALELHLTHPVTSWGILRSQDQQAWMFRHHPKVLIYYCRGIYCLVWVDLVHTVYYRAWYLYAIYPGC